MGLLAGVEEGKVILEDFLTIERSYLIYVLVACSVVVEIEIECEYCELCLY